MKKVVAILLTIMLVIGCCVFSATAENAVIDPQLQKIIDNSNPNDIISVEIFYKGNFKSVDEMPSWPDRIAAAKELNAYANEVQSQYQAVIFDGIEVTNIDYHENAYMTDADVKVKDIQRIADSGLVQKIYYLDNVAGEPEITLCKYKFDTTYSTENIIVYKELFYHKDNSGETDWVLLHVKSSVMADAIYEDIIGNRVICNPGLYYPFESGYGLYDVKQDTFVTVYGSMVNDYNGLSEAFDEVGYGKLLGDVDGDNSISIVDATVIQRCLASLRDYPDDDEIDGSFENIRYYSDFNRDGERDILDATCIQRYLVGLPYSTGGATTKPTVSLSFEDIDNVYKHNTVTATATGKAPFTYCYTIHGIFHANSEYGDDLGEYYRSEDQFEPGGVFFTTGYIDSNVTAIPTHSITYGDPFELIVTVKDANGRESSPVTVSFYNR